MTLLADVLALAALHAATGAAVWWYTRRSRDRHWRAKLRRQELSWARAFARIPQSARRYSYTVFNGGRDGAA